MDYVKFTGDNRKLLFPEFVFDKLFLLSFSYQLCLLVSYVTSNVVKLMFMAYFSLLSVTMMVISDRVNDAEHLLYMLVFKTCL